MRKFTGYGPRLIVAVLLGLGVQTAVPTATAPSAAPGTIVVLGDTPWG